MSNQNKTQGLVRQIRVSPILNRILSESLIIAKNFHHQFYTPEHVLSIAIKEPFVEKILSESGANTKILQENVTNFLVNQIPVISKDANPDIFSEPFESAGFQAMMNRAIFHTLASESDFIDITDLLISMFDETKNHCSYFMKISGINRLHLIENITKSRPPRPKIIQNSQNQNINTQNLGMIGDPFTNNTGGLKRFCVNMTEMAKKGVYDSLIGRTEELNRTIQILCRRTKNNPLHVGDAGVGKTAITQGLALQIVQQKVPEILKDYTIYSLDLGLVLSGTKFRGDFEERLNSIIKELKEQKKSILFIDEIHMIMGAGTNGSSQTDAANLLKPVLASGEIKVIGSTTFEEYAKNFEKDKALARRFQKIDILEPSIEESIKIVKGLIPKFEEYHNVKYSNGAIENAVKLSSQFLPDRRLPDKAIDLIDESGSFLHIKNFGQKSKKSIVSSELVKEITAKIARIPLASIKNDEKIALKNICDTMKNDIFGQDKAIIALANAVKRARAGFRNLEKPEASFLFVGPTGCGKTELAKTLAKILNEPLLRYDMSEYQEKHSVSRLVGSPPGYVGFEEGGQLTKDVRKNPHSVILFDEIEKANEDIYNILLQVMDYGQLTDNQGRKSDFRSCIIIMTSNAGARDLEKGGIGFGKETNDKSFASLTEAVNKEFSPEFRNRLDAVIPFNFLDINVAKMVCKKEIEKLSTRLLEKKVKLFVTDSCVDLLTKSGYSKEFGARNMARTIETKLADSLVDEVLFGRLEKGGKVTADFINDKIEFVYS